MDGNGLGGLAGFSSTFSGLTVTLAGVATSIFAAAFCGAGAVGGGDGGGMDTAGAGFTCVICTVAL